MIDRNLGAIRLTIYTTILIVIDWTLKCQNKTIVVVVYAVCAVVLVLEKLIKVFTLEKREKVVTKR